MNTTQLLEAGLGLYKTANIPPSEQLNPLKRYPMKLPEPPPLPKRPVRLQRAVWGGGGGGFARPKPRVPKVPLMQKVKQQAADENAKRIRLEDEASRKAK